MHNGCKSTYGICKGQNADYHVGTISHFGGKGEMPIGPWAGIAGYNDIGWYYTAKFPPTYQLCPNCTGAPSEIQIGSGQRGATIIEGGKFLLFAISYPKQATFKVNILGPSWVGRPPMSINMSTYENVTNLNENWDPNSMSCTLPDYWRLCEHFGTAIGPSWYFDSNTGLLYIRVVNAALYSNAYRNDPVSRPYNWEHSFDGIKMSWSNGITYVYQILVDTCVGCDVIYTDTSTNIKYYKADKNPPPPLPKLQETLYPTIAPTPFPTTLFPTPAPVGTLPGEPSKHPTVTPTIKPTTQTNSPSASPTPSPTPSPSPSPTLTPSESPTYSPTSNPSPFPTHTPTLNTPSPTDQPTPLSAAGLIRSGYSELVDVPTMGEYDVNNYPTQINCPHNQSNLNSFSATLAQQLITIPSGSKILLKKADVENNNNNTHPFGRILIEVGAELIFDDDEITIHVEEITVKGSLKLGSETCRLEKKINIIFHGSRALSSLSTSDTVKTSKGIIVNGETAEIGLHGKLYHPTWTRLAKTAEANDNTIILQDKTNWEIGQEIVIITSSFYDCPLGEEYPYCYQCYSWELSETNKPTYLNPNNLNWCLYRGEVQNDDRKRIHQNEVRKIIDKQTGFYGDIITLNETLKFSHYAGKEYQIEVALLSRNIVFKGTKTNDLYGGHIFATGKSNTIIQGIELINFGQRHVLGRYPIHMHLQRNMTNIKITDNSVVNSNWRAYVLHGTDNTIIERNVAFSIRGMAYYNEDGVEENNIFKYNFAGHIHTIYRPSWQGGQDGETFETIHGDSSTLIENKLFLPFDTAASGFYIPNAYNIYIGNVASGGWAGFSFPNLPESIGVHYKNSPINDHPQTRPTLKFYGNTAHSSGFYWKAHGPCIYTGGKLTQLTPTTWRYKVGRESRKTKDSNGNEAFMIFDHTKTFLCTQGVTHWGNRIQLRNFEAYDTLRGAELFGKASIYRGLIHSRSNNYQGWFQQEKQNYANRVGFQFYDTHIQTILSHITFRNYTKNPLGTNYPDDSIVIYKTHSDRFLPQGINAVKALKFENCDLSLILKKENCGQQFGCGNDPETQSGRIYSVWDYDGTYSLSGRRSILGSWRDWWYINDTTCNFIPNMGVYRCDWLKSRSIGFFTIYINGIHGGCKTTFGTCQGQGNAGYTVGTISQFGGNGKIPLSPWAGISGYTNIGWYFRASFPETYTLCPNCEGAPSKFELGEGLSGGFQIWPGHFIVLAISYPKNAEFEVNIIAPHWGNYAKMRINMSNFINVTQKEENWNPNLMKFSNQPKFYEICYDCGTAVGPAWYFDKNTGLLYIRVVNAALYSSYYKDDITRRPWNWKFELDNMIVPSMNGITFKYEITVTKCDGCIINYTDSSNNIKYYNSPNIQPIEWDKLQETLPPTGKPTPFPTINKYLGKNTENNELQSNKFDLLDPKGYDMSEVTILIILGLIILLLCGCIIKLLINKGTKAENTRKTMTNALSPKNKHSNANKFTFDDLARPDNTTQHDINKDIDIEMSDEDIEIITYEQETNL